MEGNSLGSRSNRYVNKAHSRSAGRSGSSSARSKNGGGKRAKARGRNDQLVFRILIGALVVAAALLALSIRFYSNSGKAQLPDRALMEMEESEREKYRGLIPKNVTYRGIDLGGMTADEARQKLEEEQAKIFEDFPQSTLRYGSDKQKLSPYELGLRLDIEALIKEAVARGEQASGVPVQLKDHFRVDDAAFDEMFQQLREEVNQKGKDARATGFSIETLKFTFEKEKEGRQLKEEEAKPLLRDLVDKKDWGREIDLPIELTKPGRTAEEMQKMLGHVAGAATPILSYSPARNTNVQIAADRLGGLIIEPGESISYEKIVGPYTEENGYKEAGIQDMYGNDSLGIAGGLCQPSTTLYQAAVRSNLEIKVHNFHSTPVLYCPIGTDAMVAPGADLVIYNPTEYPYAISSYFDGSQLAFDFYGPPNPDNAEIDLYVEELEKWDSDEKPMVTRDASVPIDESSEKVKPRQNRHVKVYKTYTVDGQVVKSELMYDHIYPGSGGVVALNPNTRTGADGQIEKQSETQPSAIAPDTMFPNGLPYGPLGPLTPVPVQPNPGP